ncbi:gas vesicle protein [Actinoallomurus rhizosphaericola]|uniref:gas vesicle protein n=1 Tax=Actinoallomurus rhizosphaericola TaxID=2952536 RepID=UPI002093D650|nr:gas vesicle protein [Actinoallomurus rhizosphaericola]MCO5998033.1 gas vesicle protein [Actinoallomurus rhizosphaericola]
MTVDRSAERMPAARGGVPAQRVALVDLLDRLLAGGVVISGDLTLSIADVDLVRISLRVLIGSVGGDDVIAPRRSDVPGTRPR